MDTQKKAVQLLSLLVEKENVAVKLSEINKQIATQIGGLNEAMDDEEINSITVQGIEFKPKEETSFSLIGTEKDTKWDESKRWFDWLRAVGEGGLIKTKESVHFSTREKFLKEWIENGEEKPEFVQENIYSTIKWNKSAVKRLVDKGE